MEAKKYLIATGCSFTEGHKLGESGSWATYFAQNNNLKLINLGKGGSGNEYILTNIVQWSKLNKDIADNAIFGIQLSESLRTLVCLDFPENDSYPKYWHITPSQFIREDGFSGWDLSEHHNKFIYDNRYKLAPFYLNVTNSVLITINAIMGFVDFCRVNNYSFFIFDGLSKCIPEKVNNKYKLINPQVTWDTYDILTDDTTDLLDFFKNAGKPIIHEKIINYINCIPEYIKDDVCKYYLENKGQTEQNYIEYYTIGNQGHPNVEGAKCWANYLQNKVKI